MKVLPANASDETILNRVREWVNLLAADRVEEALALLSAEDAERDWPPDRVREAIAGYELEPDVLSAVTPVETARAEDIQPSHTVDRWEHESRPGVVGDVAFDLPVNGVWSDLTALFWIKQVPEGLALELYDIHIL